MKADDSPGANAKMLIGLALDSNFDDHGASLLAEAGIRGTIFQSSFDIASAGVYATWASTGYMAVMAWMAVFLFDLRELRQVPFYVINFEYSARTFVQITAGDPCSFSLPAPAVAIRETRTFISATYYYGIPLVANVNLNVQLVGWYELGYGIQFKKANGSGITLIPGQIGGYVKPATGISGQISANVESLVASAGLKGSLDVAKIGMPTGAALYVGALSPNFTAGFGDILQLEGSFLSGTIDLDVEIWNCCCWSCGFKCCLRCGGSCNKMWTYNILKWDGITPPPFKIRDDTNLCSKPLNAQIDGSFYSRDEQLRLSDSSQGSIEPWQYNYDDLQTVTGVSENDDEVARRDSDDWCDCIGHCNLFAALGVDYQPYTEKFGWASNISQSLVCTHL